MLYLTRTLVMAGIIIVLAVLTIIEADSIPKVSFDSRGSAKVPMAVAVALLFLTGLMLIEEFISVRRGIRSDVSPEILSDQSGSGLQSWSIRLRSAACFLLFLIYVAVLQFLEVAFWIVTFAFNFLCGRVLRGRAAYSAVGLSIVSAVVALGIEFMIGSVFLIGLP